MSLPDNLNDHKATVKPGLMLIFLVFAVIIGLFLSNFVGFMVLLPFFGGDIKALGALLENPTATENMRMPVLILQLIASTGAFVVTPYLFLRYYEKRQVSELSPGPKVSSVTVIITVLAVVMMMPVNSVFEGLNRSVVLPDFLSGLEEILQAQEKKLGDLTVYITAFDSVWELLLGIFVIALIPAVGEELLFRGLVQRILKRWFGNIHAAVWVSAFLFGAVHFQFYGLLPRMLLGAFFGYLYVWSGNLRIPIIAHFVNNAFTLIILYLFNNGYIETDPMTLEIPVFVIILSGIIGLGLTVLLYKRYKKYRIEGRVKINKF